MRTPKAIRLKSGNWRIQLQIDGQLLDYFILTPYDYLSMKERYSEVFA